MFLKVPQVNLICSHGGEPPALGLDDDNLTGGFHSSLFSRAKSPGPWSAHGHQLVLFFCGSPLTPPNLPHSFSGMGVHSFRGMDRRLLTSQLKLLALLLMPPGQVYGLSDP